MNMYYFKANDENISWIIPHQFILAEDEDKAWKQLGETYGEEPNLIVGFNFQLVNTILDIKTLIEVYGKLILPCDHFEFNSKENNMSNMSLEEFNEHDICYYCSNMCRSYYNVKRGK